MSKILNSHIQRENDYPNIDNMSIISFRIKNIKYFLLNKDK